MDDFPTLLARDFNFRPSSTSAPMSSSKPGSFRSDDRSSPAYDNIFAGFDDLNRSDPPVHDKPVYDDDMFEGVAGVKTAPGDEFDNVFAGMEGTGRGESRDFDDILENLGRTAPEEVKEVGISGFEELIPGFGGISQPLESGPSESKQQSAASSAKPIAEDPFAVLETNSTSAYSSELFTDPLEHINKPMNHGSPENSQPASGGLFDDEELTKPSFTTKIQDDPLDTTSLNTEKEPSHMSFRDAFENIPPKVQPTKSSNSLGSAGNNGGLNFGTNYNPYERYDKGDPSPNSYDHLGTADDVWLTVSEIPLFTEPTRAPPPSRPPPPVAIRQTSVGMRDQFYSDGINSKVRDTYSSSQSTHTYSSTSQLDELDDFVSGKPRFVNEHAEVPIGDEELETNSAAAAMKEAMDRAEIKFKHAREVRERERDAKSVKSRELEQKERYEKTMPYTQYPEEDVDEQRLAREQEQRERDEKEEQKRRQKEREVLERDRARQAVERATREARERASTEARLRAERAAVDKANAEARQRAERAAFQKASTEARERAGIEARERAEREKTAAEAREREKAASEAKERERVASEARDKERSSVRERAAVERAAQEARIRAQRAAVDRVAAEARERAAAEAQRRAAATATATAREKQQKTDIDFESFFNYGARPSSAPKQRNPTSEAGFDAQFQNKGTSDGLQRQSTASSSTIRKAHSTVNITDDLASIFGAPASSGDFQDVEGETEERRRARFERHQRTLERTVKALAEKNERDMQVQRDQAERHRIAETLDFEIRRWAAGKEGNLRALLSTLQYVLWPECGWQPVSLTDLITGASVKKVYRKATLCIHPDKVQQKGATLQQKCIAEKVFDLLKEAWNKFNSEELF